MILSIYGYGQSVLKKKAEPIDRDYPDLENLIANMWETMYQAQGVGLAAPQIGLPIRLFIVDTEQIQDKGRAVEGLKHVFINAEKVDIQGEIWTYEEGCLSIPDIRGDVERPQVLHLRYLDENFEPQETVFTGMTARVIQHEYDHIEGVLFVEHLKPVRKRLIRRKLENIKKGKIKVDYKMRFSGKG